MIIINNKSLEDIYCHVRQAYPHECCGVLSGKNNPCKEVLASYAVTNLNAERAHDRYELDPLQFQRIDDRVQKMGWEILGIYHSHPDHPCAPSETDTQRAWDLHPYLEGYSYFIIAVQGGDTTLEVKSWVMNEQGTFEEEKIVGKSEGHS